MHPSIWGPHLWFILHIISFEYPEKPTEYDKRIYHDFYTALKDVIPCTECRKHYRDHITKYPLTPHLDTRDNLIKWVVQVHNFVNISLGKPTFTLEQVLAVYKDLKPQSPFIKVNTEEIIRKTEQKEYYRLYTFIILAGIVIVLCRYYFNRYYFSF
jgi:Erv1 / Alr family